MRLGVQDRARGGAGDLDLLAPPLRWPSRARRAPRSCAWPSVRLTSTEKLLAYQHSGDAAGAAGVLEGAGVGGAGGPGIGRLAGGRDGGVSGVAGGVADDVVALGAVGADPVALRRGVLLDQEVAVGRGGWRRRAGRRTAR